MFFTLFFYLIAITSGLTSPLCNNNWQVTGPPLQRYQRYIRTPMSPLPSTAANQVQIVLDYLNPWLQQLVNGRCESRNVLKYTLFRVLSNGGNIYTCITSCSHCRSHLPGLPWEPLWIPEVVGGTHLQRSIKVIGQLQSHLDLSYLKVLYWL